VKRRIADILIQELARAGAEHVFMLAGGGAMYLVDALGRSGVRYVCCHHEQAAGIAAQAYAMRGNRLGVCLVTTGPGGTNALTPCAAAYMDSTPVLFLSGQVKTADFASRRGVRQYGAQENDVVSMAAPVTKYAVLAEDPRDALYELQKALFLAMSGRRGPVWLDVPLDVQSAEMEEEALRRFVPPVPGGENETDGDSLERGVGRTLELLSRSRRPLILVGHGVVAAGAEESFRRLAARLGIPVQATWRALGVLGRDDPLFFGSPGLQAVRSANLILQGADFLLTLGTRLDNMITAFAESRFAFRAKKVVVDVDGREIAKLSMPAVDSVVSDAARFLDCLAGRLPARPTGDVSAWLAFCAGMRDRFPLSRERRAKASDLADPYALAAAVGAAGRDGDSFVVTSTSLCNTAGHIALGYRRGQFPVSSMGFGSMGFALPAAVGTSFASGGGRVIMLEGDGSFQLNVQELQTVAHYGVDAKMFVYANRAYASIAAMQDRNFSGFRVGSDAASGVTMPDLEGIARAYGFPFVRIALAGEVEAGVRKAMDLPGPVLCEAVGDAGFEEIPKCVSTLDMEGRRVSSALENPYPFLPEGEVAAIYERLPGG
jgi:acetolactate synthase-1/2/3 large subunit